jgi:hypothetical protein
LKKGTGNREQSRGQIRVEMSGSNNFKDLRIWQKGIDIAKKCYFLIKLFPKDELYSMVQQIRKSADSMD